MTMTKKIYIQPETEIIQPLFDPIQEEAPGVPVHWSKTNGGNIESNDGFFDDSEKSNSDNFFDD